jgi:predicted DNA-binding transcriptional regulator AlpA
MGCAAQVIAGSEEFIDVREVSRRCSLSDKSIRKIIKDDALPHFRNGRAGKILLRWSDFVTCMERRKTQLENDDNLLGILRDMTKKARR